MSLPIRSCGELAAGEEQCTAPRNAELGRLIDACIARDRRAQRSLYERFVPYALRIVRRYGVAGSSVADVVQEVFAEVFVKLPEYDGERAAFTTWLRTISVRRSIDHLRRREREEFVELDRDYADSSTVPAIDFAPYTNAAILLAIAALPTGYRTVFNLYAVEGYRHGEIAEILSITPAASRSQYTRARQRLRLSLRSTDNPLHHE